MSSCAGKTGVKYQLKNLVTQEREQIAKILCASIFSLQWETEPWYVLSDQQVISNTII